MKVKILLQLLLLAVVATTGLAAKHKFKDGDKITLWANKGKSHITTR
jgi:hypothetical protein